MSELEEGFEATTGQQRRILAWVLALNVVLVVSLAVAGVLADSSGLIANALDNASDAAVYAISLFAVGRSPLWKTRAAGASGLLLVLFGLGVLADTVRRVLTGSEPIGPTMIAMAVVAGVLNLLCLRLLGKLGTGDVNVRAAQTFSLNDFYSNGGVLVAGALTALTGAAWPDLAVGFGVAAIAVKGGIGILRDAWGAE